MATIYVATTGNDSTGDGSVGNPYASPGKAASVAGSGDTIYVKSGTYTLTTSTPGAEGPVLLPSDGQCLLEGYSTTPGDLGTAPVISSGSVFGLSYLVKTQENFSNLKQLVVNIALSGNNSGDGFVDGGSYGATFWRCSASGFTNGYGFNGANQSIVSLCVAIGCAAGFYAGGLCVGCVALNSINNAYYVPSMCVNCIAYAGSSCGFTLAQGSCVNCISYANSGDGFLSIYDIGLIQDCVAYGNGGYGINSNYTDNQIINFAAGNNTSGATNGSTLRDLGAISLTADPFVDAPGGNFNLNTASGGGALLRAATVSL